MIDGVKSLVEVLVEIFVMLCYCVEDMFGDELVGVVIMVFVYFDDV